MVKGPPSTADPRVPEFIQLSERITKTRRGKKNDGRPLPAKTFADHENKDTCPVRILLFYEAKKTAHQARPDGPFMLTVGPRAEREPEKNLWWYLDGPMGKHMIGEMLKEGVAATGEDTSHLKITARSARKTMAQAAADSICSPEFTSKVMGHKNLDSKLHYLKIKDPAHQATSLAISRTIAGKSENMFSDLYSKTSAAKSKPSSTVTSNNAEEETGPEIKKENVGRVQFHQTNQHLQVFPQQYPGQGQMFSPFHPPYMMAPPQQFYPPGPFYSPPQYPPFYPHPALMSPPTIPMYQNQGLYMQQGPPREMTAPVLADVTNLPERIPQSGEKPRSIQDGQSQYDRENI